MTTKMNEYIRWFETLTNKDVGIAGGKNANLGEMYSKLTAKDIVIPNGFAITADAYRYILNASNNWEKLHDILNNLTFDNLEEFSRKAQQARDVVYNTPIPNDLRLQILKAFAGLKKEYGQDVTVAVRSSATAEDLPTASFAGQQDSFLHISSDEDLIDACKRCFASLFTDRAIHYRMDNNFDHFKVALSIGVQKMVRSDIGSSGVAFTLDTESGFRDVVFITSSYGLGETIVQGAVDPDEFYVHKPTFKQGYHAVLRRQLGSKKIKMVFSKRRPTRTTITSTFEREHFSLSDDQVLLLTRYAIDIENHFGRPMDIEFGVDGHDNKLYILQARPETVISQRVSTNKLEQYRLTSPPAVNTEVLVGHAIGAKIAHGIVRKINDPSELGQFKPGEVLVAENTTPDWEPVMKLASAIVTNRGGRTCHSAIVSRELGLPAVVVGDEITIVCCAGDRGLVYRGKLDFEIVSTSLDKLKVPDTNVTLILGTPASAFHHSYLPVAGVGLARLEFIISEHIKIHPMAIVHPEAVKDLDTLKRIKALVSPYSSPRQYFIQILAEGVVTIAAAFYPKDVIVRLSDFKSNEYASLLGGAFFEVEEENPMIGFRGASRYTHPAYKEAFALECEALKCVREVMGLTNVQLMVPFCRTVDESVQVLAYMRELGLERCESAAAGGSGASKPAQQWSSTPAPAHSPSSASSLAAVAEQPPAPAPTHGSMGTAGAAGLKIYMMCEIPNNVLCLSKFLDLYDGISIGSNDLTQLCLGIDRDSSTLAPYFDERDPGVKKLIAMAIAGTREKNEQLKAVEPGMTGHKYCGICGQAPSDYPEFASFLVDCGIESISVSPDVALRTVMLVNEAEATKKSRVGAFTEVDTSTFD